MTGLSEVREKLEGAQYHARTGRSIWTGAGGIFAKIDELVSEAIALMESEQGEQMRRHEPWCNSHKLALCSGCSVKKGWDRNGLTGEPTKCCHGSPHEWLFKPCTCGSNDQRRCNRRRSADAILGTESENGEDDG